jgi:glycerol kinase
VGARSRREGAAPHRRHALPASALDQGTSSSRSIVFDRRRHRRHGAAELPQIYPQPGWVEHDALEIWDAPARHRARGAGQGRHQARDVAAIGITNQRETAVVWNRKTGQPIHHAIVWQDRRGEPLCAQLREQGMADTIQQRTGLLIDSYFSGTKVRWLLDNVPARAPRPSAASWPSAPSTAGCSGSSPAASAARHRRQQCLAHHAVRRAPQRVGCGAARLLDIPAVADAAVLPSSADYGRHRRRLLGAPVRIGGVAGDQQSALFGQACFARAWPRTPTAPAASC